MNKRRKRTRVEALIEGNHGTFVDDGSEGESAGGEPAESADPKPETISAQEFANLKSQLDVATQELDRWKAKREEEAKHRKAAEEEAARKAGDTEALDASWREKEQSWQQERETFVGHFQKTAVSTEAKRIAANLAIKGSETVLERIVRDRLTAEFVSPTDPAAVKVLTADGKPSALTLDELEKELQNDKALAPIIVGSRARGAGGSDPSAGGGGGNTVRNSDLPTDPRERAKFFASNPGVKIISD